MPKRSAKRFSSAQRTAQNLKRLTALVFTVALLVTALGRFGMRFDSLAAFAQSSDESQERKIMRDDCNYLREPEGFKGALARHREEVSRATDLLVGSQAQPTTEDLALVPPQSIPRKNFIDNIIFDKMAKDNVQSAPLCTDEEFIRRVYLDVTGRIPAASDVTSFLNDKSTTKRDALVDKLIGSPEYVDKWTMFFGDLLGNSSRATNIQIFSGGRDAYYTYIKNALTTNKSYAQMATELITATGDNFVAGEANFIVLGNVAMGPQQDTYDGLAVDASQKFLGIGAMDCLLCHSGAGHLDNVNLWGSQRTRPEAWGMSAFFARYQKTRTVISQQPNYFKYTVTERPNGEYQLNTDFGNRQTRAPINGQVTVAPQYILGGGGLNAGENRRQALARLITNDKQFARAAVNYIWEKLMVEALVSPSNGFDPARLDPKAVLPEGWALQPANAELLEALANDFITNKYDLRKLIATIVKSNTYQLSAQYPGTWTLALVPYYARKFARRLDAEEVHDAILKATGIGITYQLRDQLGNNTFTVNWAMQLPDPTEPRGNAQSVQLLNSFIRGDRDVKPRSQEPSIQQALNLMNSQFVMTRVHQRDTGSAVRALLADANLTPTQIVTQLYLNTLSRNPSQSELDKLTPLFSSLGRQPAAEAVQWSLINKMDFCFNY